MANSLSQFYKQPANFLYIFASDSFISQLGKWKSVIRIKKQNQKKLLNTTAVDEGITYETAYKNIAESFKSYYGVTPQKALTILASGGEVAGKNWSKGIYGIGATGEVQVNYTGGGSNSSVAIDATGQFRDTNTGKTLTTEIVSFGKDGNPNCVKYTDPQGNVYTADKTKKNGWVSSQFSNKATGQTYNANGTISTPADMSSIWESLSLSLSKIVEWLLSLFNKETGSDKKLLTAANTQPTQQDGWVSNAGISPLVLIGVLGGTILFSGGLTGFWKKAKKSKK